MKAMSHYFLLDSTTQLVLYMLTGNAVTVYISAFIKRGCLAGFNLAIVGMVRLENA